MNQNVSTLLSNLDKINSQSQKPIFVPSLNRDVHFKLLTAAQHKHILTTIVEQNNSGVSLSLLLNQIIKDNICEKVSINTLDKSYILIGLRAHSLSYIYEHNNVKTNLVDILSNKIPLDIESKEIKENEFSILLSSPSLDRDSQVNRETKRKIDENKSEELISKIALDEIYTNEFIKYIEHVEFKQESNLVKIPFTELTHTQKRLIVDKFPASTSIEIQKKINEYKELSEKFLIIDNSKISISFDQSFFTV